MIRASDFKRACCLSAALLTAAAALGAPAGETLRHSLSIGPLEARRALAELSRQTGTPLLYLSEDLGAVVVHPVQGRFSVEQALDLMLDGTGIRAELNNNGVITVSFSAPPPPPWEAVPGEAAAEDEAAPAQAESEASPAPEEVVITGSRLRQSLGMTTGVPVTSVLPQDLQRLQPASTVAEQLDALPQFFATQTAQRGGGALFGSAGASYLNMRGMGSARTLVLFDGARVVPADRSSSVNVDTLPLGLLRNVEVVTGGASAAYGADALAGVVNFVLDREFEGLKISSGTGLSERGDGHNWNLSLAGGRRFGQRLNLIASLEARHIRQISREPEDLDNFRRWGFVTNPAWDPADPPGTQPQRLTLPWVHSTVHSAAGLINQPGFKYDRQTFTGDGRATRPFIRGDVVSPIGPGSTGSQSGGAEARLADRAFYGGPYGAEVINRSAFLGWRYEFSDSALLFGQVMLGHTESNQHDRRGNPHLQADTWHATVFRDNPFLPEDVRGAMEEAGLESIRVDKLGQLPGPGNFNDARNDRNSHDMLSWMLGAELELREDWQLRASYQHGLAEKTSAVYGNLRLDRLFMAIDAVRDPASGAVVCNVQLHNPTPAQLAEAVRGRVVPTQNGLRSLPSPVGLDDSIRDCRPLNIFGHGNASRDAAAYVVGNKVGLGEVQQDFVELLLTGEPAVNRYGPLATAFGLSWRDESFWQDSWPGGLDGPPLNVPELGIRGIPPGFEGGSTSLFQFAGVPAIHGGFHVWEAFAELNLPLWAAGAGSPRLDGNLAWRRSDYSIGGQVDSWKLGLDLRLSDALRLRATHSRDVREATFSERFDIQGIGGNVNDPAWDGSNFELTLVNGGNPRLEPEIADTLTLGLVLEPASGPFGGLQFSADWYEIDLERAIGQLGPQRIVNECHGGLRPRCGQLIRNDEGILVSVNDLYLNIDAARVRGIDMELLYAAEPDFFPALFESFNLRALAGYLQENSSTAQGGPRLEQAGGLNWPQFNAVVQLAYDIGPLGLRLQQRYIDSTRLNLYWEEGVDVDDNSVASQSITNLGLLYRGETLAGAAWQLVLDVHNLWDRDPPVVPSFSQRSGAQQVNNNFDVFGRRYQLGLTVDF